MGRVYVIMGVSGSGKSTIGKKLAKRLELPFYDADDFHPKSNVDKMALGIPLEDKDRLPWLEKLRDLIPSWKHGGVLACSALKESYRQILMEKKELNFIFLKGDYQTIYNRMKNRKHFMKPEMLKSQFDDLEVPTYGLTITIDQNIESAIEDILLKLNHMGNSDIGIIGMGVMGKSLAKNFVSKGYRTSVFNRPLKEEIEIIPNLLREVNNANLSGYADLEAFVNSLSIPRKIIMMIPSGKPVDDMIGSLTPLLKQDDILVDGGNSHFRETQEREKTLKDFGICYLGIGISGGEKGALEGPAMMVGGARTAFEAVKPMLSEITAKGIKNKSCLGYFGSDGAGHFIKTVHNGIEYGEMQLLAEIYAHLKPYLSYEQIYELLSEWNQDHLSSFLLETTLAIFNTREGNDFVLDKVLDVAQSKGTGTWTSQLSLNWGLSTPTLTEAVMARSLSQLKTERTKIAKSLAVEMFDVTINTKRLKIAYAFARNINLLQGLHLIQTGSDKQNWDINLSEVLRTWTNGCILRSELLEEWYHRINGNKSIWEMHSLFQELYEQEGSISEVLLEASQQRTPMPCFSSALHYWYGLTTEQSSANLIQAQRDAFGAHTYKRVDKDINQSFTTKWNGNG